MKNFRDLVGQARTLATEYTSARTAAERPDPDLNPEADARRRSEQVGKVREQFGARFDALLATARAERDTIAAAARKARPSLDGDDAAALVRTEQAWSHNVRPLLEKGRTVAEALEGQGADEALGAERFGSSWLAQHATEGTPASHAREVSSAVAGALAALAPSPGAAEAILAGDAVDRDLSALEQVVGHAREGRALEAAMAARYTD